MNRNFVAIMCTVGLIVSGCATIVGDKSQLVPISSTPGGAQITITDEKLVEVFKGTTPTTVTLPKSDGSYWGGKEFTVKIAKEGFTAQIIQLKSHPNGWYIGGNIIFGGLIGWFIVDPFNGGMYTLSPKDIAAVLGENGARNNPVTNGGISIVLLEDVPTALRPSLVKIN